MHACRATRCAGRQMRCECACTRGRARACADSSLVVHVNTQAAVLARPAADTLQCYAGWVDAYWSGGWRWAPVTCALWPELLLWRVLWRAAGYRPVQVDDELVVVACPDPPGAEDCRKLVRMVRRPLAAQGRAVACWHMSGGRAPSLCVAGSTMLTSTAGRIRAGPSLPFPAGRAPQQSPPA